MKPEIVTEILEKHSSNESNLIAILEEIQARYSYLPEDALRIVSEKCNIPLVDIYGVATFYKAFSLVPRGKHLCSVCVGTACHVRGAQTIAREFGNHLGVPEGGTTEDKEFTLETVNCVGACALGPIVVVDGKYYSNVDPTEVEKIIKNTREGVGVNNVEQDYHIFPVEVSCPRCNHNLMDTSYSIDGYPSIRVTASHKDRHGWLRLSSLYGSYNVFSQHEVEPDVVVSFFCPHCHGHLSGSTTCTECDAPVVNMIVKGGGIVQICSRNGCKGHRLDLNGVNV